MTKKISLEIETENEISTFLGFIKKLFKVTASLLKPDLRLQCKVAEFRMHEPIR